MYASPELQALNAPSDAIAKYDPSAPVIHGTLYFGICGGEHIRILCRRTIQHRPRIGLLLKAGSGIRLVEA